MVTSFLVVVTWSMLAGFFTSALAAESMRAKKSRLYLKKNTWSRTLLSLREEYAAWWCGQLGHIKLGPWYVRTNAGKQRDDFVPGDKVDFSETDASQGHLWTKRLNFYDGIVHHDLSDKSEPVSYQLRTLTVDKPAKVTAWLGALSGLELWLNGRKIFSETQMGNGMFPEPEQAKVELKLQRGENQLVLKTTGSSRWGGFYFSLVPYSKLSPSPVDVLLEQMVRDFPIETSQMQRGVLKELIVTWFRYPNEVDLTKLLAECAIEGLGNNNKTLQAELKQLIASGVAGNEEKCLDLYSKSCRFRKAWGDLANFNFRALKMAIEDLTKSFPEKYARGTEYLERAEAYQKALPQLRKSLKEGSEEAIRQVEAIAAFQRQALLSNPLLDFEKLLLIKRRPHGDPRVSRAHRGLGNYMGMPQQASFQLHRIRQTFGWENEIAELSMSNLEQLPRRIYAPLIPRLLSGINLHFDAEKMLFAMPGSHNRWQVFEMDVIGQNLRQVTPGDQPDVDNFDACYLPNGKIIFISTAPCQGVPCNPSIKVAMSYLMDADSRNIQQLTFEQDHNYYPTVMNDGRVLYLRWEYTDIPHVWGRYLFTMNPDGTGQRAYYGSGAYWPNSIFFARPIPNHPTKVVGIASGHHIGREGELVLFDPAVGRKSTDGVVQRIPGYGRKVQPLVQDKLTEDSWPKFVHPYPLSEKYLIVSCKPTPEDLWGIYLVDVFDNMLLLKELEGYALFEPTALRKRKTPPVIPEMTNPERQDALMYVVDVYAGPGLKDVPRGSVKKLRLYTYHFAYDKTVGITNRVGTNGPWEPKRILGTVPVAEDGSAFFRVPAKTPISIQPLDAEGKALQLMRSWATAMPGEIVSCIGCHENQSSAALNRRTIAIKSQPQEIQPWHGPVRGFSFKREVQPVLDKYCVACHDGSPKSIEKGLPDLRAEQGRFVVFKRNTPLVTTISGVSKKELLKKYAGVFEPSFITLRSFVRVGGLESDLRQQAPGEFYVDTSELVQMLQKGHHGVKLDSEAWDRIITWIDLNAPCHGTWRETAGMERIEQDYGRRRQLRSLYDGIDEDPESYPEMPVASIKPIKPECVPKVEMGVPHLASWPFDTVEAKRRQQQANIGSRKIALGNGIQMEFVFIPAGDFVMGELAGYEDEKPLAHVKFEEPFWIGRFEVTNEQYACFDLFHDSCYEHAGSMIFSEYDLGPLLNQPKQPVVRISWRQAQRFCEWLSKKTGYKVSLPTEAQWEYACRAGTSSPLFYGGQDTDFSTFANMADVSISQLAYWGRHDVPDLIPRDGRFDDGMLVTADGGSYKANPWGLHDMHGNVWEWTRSEYRSYPYRADDGRNDITIIGKKVVRGGSWYDRPKRCRSAFRLGYPAWQKVYNVGFRVSPEVDDKVLLAADPR